MPESLLRVSELSKRYGEVQALRDVSFRTERGEVFGLLGPNGSGKTTLLHAVVGLTRPDSGSIDVAGLSHDTSEAKRLMSFMPDGLPRPEVLTGYEFVEMTAALYGTSVDPAWLAKKAAHLDLDPGNLDRPLGALSHGMGRKIDLLAALVGEPELLILDEPASGLDPIVSSRLEDLVGRWPGENRGVLLSTHDLALAERLCDRIAIIGSGEVLASGTVSEITAVAGAANLREAFLMLTDD